MVLHMPERDSLGEIPVKEKKQEARVFGQRYRSDSFEMRQEERRADRSVGLHGSPQKVPTRPMRNPQAKGDFRLLCLCGILP